MRIVIADDDALLREGIAALLRGEGHDIVATVGGPESLLAAVATHAPDLVVVDVRMPPTHTDEGIRAAVEARHRNPGLPVLVLSAYVEQSFAHTLLAQAPGSGGSRGVGYLLKERVGRVAQLVDALERVAAGETVIDPEVVAQLFARRRTDEALATLSPREREVLGLMAEGLGNGAIAERLVVTDNAVHKHIRSIFGKLGLAPDDASDRRVAATLRYLEATAADADAHPRGPVA